MSNSTRVTTTNVQIDDDDNASEISWWSLLNCCNYKLELTNTKPFAVIPFIIIGFAFFEAGLQFKYYGLVNMQVIPMTAIIVLILTSLIILIHFTYNLSLFSFLILSTSVIMSSIFFVTSLETDVPPQALINEGTTIKWVLDAQKDCCGYYGWHDWIHGNITNEGIASCCNKTTFFTCAFDENPPMRYQENWDEYVSAEGCADKLDNLSQDLRGEKFKSAVAFLFLNGILGIDLIIFSFWKKYKKVYSQNSPDIDGENDQPRETVVFG